jgi:hypothetical protein
MKFTDIKIDALDLESTDNICRLIIEYLCDEKYNPELFKNDQELLTTLIKNMKGGELNYRQLNELLLLLNQDKLGKDFFDFFFEKDKIKLDELKRGITKFRGFALLCFGNFRFAYKRLIQKSKNELITDLSPFCIGSSEIVEQKYKNRPQKMLEIEHIPRDKTWCLGEVSGRKVNKEAEELEEERKIAKKGKNCFREEELSKFGSYLAQMATEIQGIQKQAFRNTDIYLTWDYMDVYIATSMRNIWEYEETYDFVKSVFSNRGLEDLNLRFFDPTQSKCANSREKGLLEGLMLKRAFCTIYLAQETDTMGKDSELAATLAQSKPVIAYVPKRSPEEYSRKISKYPLGFFKRRLLILDAEEVFEDSECIKKLEKCDKNFGQEIDQFLIDLNQYRLNQPFSLWTEKEEKFKKDCKNFQKICKILAIAECHNFDRRAELLKGMHPLSMQVDLQSGVANGVLVVRSAEDCADLLYKVLTNQMTFSIKHKYPQGQGKREEGYTVLEESISQSPFRVVVDQRRLTNSFWNLFA